MEEINPTKTTTVETIECKIKNMNPCLFVLFAEYLGYLTPYIEWCEEYFEKKSLSETKMKIIQIVATNFLHQAKKDFTLIEIETYYDTFHEFLTKWEDMMKK